jgi:signal transduction histidine kinase
VAANGWNPFADGSRPLLERQRAVESELARLPLEPKEPASFRLGWHSDPKLSARQEQFAEIDLRSVQPLDAVVLVPVDLPYGGLPGAGYGFPPRFRVEVATTADFKDAATLYETTGADFPNPGRLPVWLPAGQRAVRFIRVKALKLWSRGDAELIALAEIITLSGARNVASGAGVKVSSSERHTNLWAQENLVDGQTPLGLPVAPLDSRGIVTHGYRSWTVRDKATPLWAQIDLGRPCTLDEVRLVPSLPPDFPVSRGFGFPVRWRLESALEPDFQKPAMLADYTGADYVNPQHNIVTIPVRQVTARFLRLTATQQWNLRSDEFIFSLAEIESFSGGQNVARDQPARDSGTVRPALGSWDPSFLTDGQAPGGRLIPLPEWLRGLSRRRELQRELGTLTAQRQRLSEAASQMAQRALFGTGAALVSLGVFIPWRSRRIRRSAEATLRRRIAADLHDEIGCHLGHIALLTELAQQGAPDHLRPELREIEQLARGTSDSMRDIVWLMNRGGTSSDLCARLREAARQTLNGLEWTFDAPDSGRATSFALRREVVFAFKETLHNIRKHAAAQHIGIQIREADDCFSFAVQDDGVGFEVEQATTGQGLENLKQRAENLDGQATIVSALGRGTRVTFQVSFRAVAVA